MSKQEFLKKLRKGLAGLPEADMEERLAFYSEMIDDWMEEGLSEAEAVFQVGSIEKIVAQILEDSQSVPKGKRKMKTWELVLLILGSPIWLSLLLAAFAVLLSIYVVLCSVIISFWGIFVSFIGCAFGCIVAGIIFACLGKIPVGVAVIGVGMVCVGLSIFMFYGCKASTKGLIILTKKCFARKEAAK